MSLLDRVNTFAHSPFGDLLIGAAARRLGVPPEVASWLVKTLVRYGHLETERPKHVRAERLEAKVRRALASYQQYLGMEPTGELTPQFENAAKVRRCGCPDVMQQKKYRASQLNRKIKYAVTGFVGGISQADQGDLIAAAWASWQAHADFEVTRVNSGAHVNIYTGQGRRDDFDGSGGTLAYANLGPFLTTQRQAMLCRFDLDERWLKSLTGSGVLFLNVAAHEFGHLLGLDHSQVSAALMAPFYNQKIDTPQGNDDVPRVQRVWGGAKTPPPAPTPGPGKYLIEVEGQAVTAARLVA